MGRDSKAVASAPAWCHQVLGDALQRRGRRGILGCTAALLLLIRSAKSATALIDSPAL